MAQFTEYFGEYVPYFKSYTNTTPPIKNNDILKPIEEEFNPVAEQFTESIDPEKKSDAVLTSLDSWTNPKTRAIKISNTPRSQSKNENQSFEEAFALAVAEDPNIANLKDFLIRTAKRESGFDNKATNSSSKKHHGYFQINEDSIKQLSGLSVDEFKNNPVAQIKTAAKLYNQFLSQVKNLGIYDLAKRKGYSDNAIVAGAWAGGGGGVKTYLLGQGNPSDSHYYGGQGGISVGQLMEEFKNG